ncbi:arginine:ornithine antiporter [Klebsiella variicola]|uniref:arginine:ornithine antiporter n=1 Tax=Klebsiella variicola TaxID=244366 RepID=UPI000E2C8C7A|nr:arginine:ornithine antiporter [Klebsiella variicola]SXF96233.1 arginine:ornithine antiporter [Klebsiella variicola]
MKIQRKSLFLFWAWMDLFFVLQFLWWNIAHRRLPLYDDLLAYLQLLHTYGSGAVWLYPLNVLLIISIPLSMILFFRQSRYALWLAWGQAPLRLVFMQPSLSLGLWLIQAAGVMHVAILAGFLLLSEGLKIASLWYCRGGAQGIKR